MLKRMLRKKMLRQPTLKQALKQTLAGSLACAALIGMSGTAQAQAPAPDSAPAAPAGQSTDVSNQEVQQFANALKQMRSIHESAQTQAGQVLQVEGMTPQRFNEILQSRSPQGTQPSSEVSEQEKAQFDQALAQITQIQQATEQQMQQAIASSGLELQRFNQIFAIARQDQALKQRIEQNLQN